MIRHKETLKPARTWRAEQIDEWNWLYALRADSAGCAAWEEESALRAACLEFFQIPVLTGERGASGLTQNPADSPQFAAEELHLEAAVDE